MGVGALLGLAAAPAVIINTPHRGGIDGDAFTALWWIIAPAVGGLAAHWLVGVGAGFDAYGVAAGRNGATASPPP